MTATAGAFFLSPLTPMATPAPQRTVREIMDLFIKGVPGAPFANTVDTLKSGDRSTVVTGVVTTMFPTVEVIRKAIEVNANFIIAHEPSFYNHADETKWLENNDVFRYKMDLLNKHKIAIWRNHDYAHSYKPDGVYQGFIDASGWKQYYQENGLFDLPSTTLQSVINVLKQKFATGPVRFIGNLHASCKKVLYMPGAPGGRRQIEAINRIKPDVAICGEIQEWETAEYVRDARSKGNNVSLVVMGHSVSEEPGSAWMAEWLKKNISDVKVYHVPSNNPFSIS